MGVVSSFDSMWALHSEVEKKSRFCGEGGYKGRMELALDLFLAATRVGVILVI